MTCRGGFEASPRGSAPQPTGRAGRRWSRCGLGGLETMTCRGGFEASPRGSAPQPTGSGGGPEGGGEGDQGTGEAGAVGEQQAAQQRLRASGGEPAVRGGGQRRGEGEHGSGGSDGHPDG